MNDTERMLVNHIIKLESQIDECLANGTLQGMKTNYIKAKRREVRYITELLMEGKKPKHPLE